jgi:hypothetical protein
MIGQSQKKERKKTTFGGPHNQLIWVIISKYPQVYNGGISQAKNGDE